jgi:diphosphomevalonate decarboxylase
VAAYTFDAGPNAVVYFLEDSRDIVAGIFKDALEQLEGWDTLVDNSQPGKLDEVDPKALAVLKEGVSRVIYTKVGEGPKRTETSLIDDQGNPLKLGV